MGIPEVIRDEITKQPATAVNPELGVDVINIGFVYSIDLDEDGICLVELTLGILGYPLGFVLAKIIEEVLVEVPRVKDVDVELRMESRWAKGRVSGYVKFVLGIS